jgi:hypothetical protein
LTLLSLGLSINAEKSACLRIGPRFKATVADLAIGNQKINWKNDLKYLGITFLASKTIKYNLQIVRQKFFRALNGVFGKIGVRSSTAVSLSLINAFCTPILLYGVEGFNFTRASYDYIESTFSKVFFKLFNIYDKSVIRECQLHCHVLPNEL